MCVHSALWAAQITEIADARMALVLLQMVISPFFAFSEATGACALYEYDLGCPEDGYCPKIFLTRI